MLSIRTENLSKAFASRPAVDCLNLNVRQGEIFGLVGPDGAGKTTSLRMLSGILQPTAGEAWVLDHPVSREPEAIKEKVGYMSQRFALYGDLTVMENLNFYADLYDVPKRERPRRMERLLGFSNLTPFTKRLAQNLSGGMKQKLGLACALVHTPQILFLDEPTSGVDPVSRRDFWRILYDLHQEGITILLSTAYLDEAERCQQIGLMHKGRLLSLGSPEEIKKIIPGELWELRCPKMREIHKILPTVPGVSSAGIFGDKIHVVISEGKQPLEALENYLRESAIGVYSLKKVTPSLEDVFMALAMDRNTLHSRAADDAP